MEDEKARSIRLPERVWNALDEDAARCRRSAQKQLEAILVSFYELDDVELNRQKLQVIGEILPKTKSGIPVLAGSARVETDEKKGKKKKRA